MTAPYFCPNCKTNRSRFNIVQQVPVAVKLDPASGEIVQTYQEAITDPFHKSYLGPEYRVQCATCSVVQEEEVFIKSAKNNPSGAV